MSVDLEKLERLAKNATPGQWANVGLGHIRTAKKPDAFIAECTPMLIRSVKKLRQCRANADYIVAACNAVPELIKRVRELERQRDEAIHYILTDEGHSMIDWRMCFFAGYCECEPHLCKPDYEMCKRAVKKAIEESGE